MKNDNVGSIKVSPYVHTFESLIAVSILKSAYFQLLAVEILQPIFVNNQKIKKNDWWELDLDPRVIQL